MGWGRFLHYGHRKWTLVSKNNRLQYCFLFRVFTSQRSSKQGTTGDHRGSSSLSAVPMSFSVTQDEAGGAEDEAPGQRVTHHRE